MQLLLMLLIRFLHTLFKLKASDFAAMEEKILQSFSAVSVKIQNLIWFRLFLLRQSIGERSIKIGEIDCFLLTSESKLVLEWKERGFGFEDDEFVPSCNE
jgi:hypothetical protein